VRPTAGMTAKVRTAFVTVMVLFSLSLCGCWGRTELENIAFLALVGLDTVQGPAGEDLPAGDAGLQVTASIASPHASSPGDSGGGPSRRFMSTVSVAAPNVSTAMQAVEMSVGRALTAIHLQAIIIGEGLARQGLEDVLDSMLRFRNLRHSVIVIIADGRARDILEKLSPTVEAQASVFLRKLIAVAADGRVTRQVHLHDLLVSSASQSKDAVLPLIRLWREITPGDGGSGAWSATLAGGAVFKDASMVGKINIIEAFHALTLRGGIRRLSQAYPVTPPPGSPATETAGTQGIVEVEWEKGLARRKISIEEKAGTHAPRVRIDVSVELTGTIVELPAHIDITRPEGLRRLQSDVEKGALFHLRRVISKAQLEFGGADIFFFGDAVRRQFATWGEWTSFDWPERFREATVDVKATVHLRRPGLTVRNVWHLE